MGRSIETIEGEGMLRSGTTEIGRVRYRLEVFAEGAFKKCSGIVQGEPRHLFQAFDARDLHLVRDDTGFAMALSITRFQHGDEAEVLVSGSPHA